MFSWIFLAVAAQCINAVVAIADKYIVTSKKAMPQPFVYAFYTCIFAGAWVVVFAAGILPMPFFATLGVPSLSNIEYPSLATAAIAFLSSYTFFIALVSLYSALRDADASDVIPVVGAVSAVVSFGLSYFFLDTRLTPHFIVGIVLLSVGTFLVSHLRFTWRTSLMSVHAGIFFAIHFVTLKGLFTATSFDNGFFWSRVTLFIVALSMLLIPKLFIKIHSQTRATGARTGLLILGIKLLAEINSILILKATALGNVAVVQALGGIQFVLILFFSLFFGHKIPPEYGENIKHPHEMYHKVVFVSIITIGFLVLFL